LGESAAPWLEAVMLNLLNMALTALPYLAFGWLLARDPSLDGIVGPLGDDGDSIRMHFWGFGVVTLVLMGGVFTGAIMMFGASGWGVLLGIAGGSALAWFGQERL
jgi:hypothetical protein